MSTRSADTPDDRRARRRAARQKRRRRAVVLLGAAVIVVSLVAVAIRAVTAGPAVETTAGSVDVGHRAVTTALPTPATTLPVPRLADAPAPRASSPTTAGGSGCDSPAVATALASGDDAATVSAFGGGAAFRTAVASGAAPCISLSDPAREWAVINKQRPHDPIDWAPPSVTLPVDVRNLAGGGLRPAPATALTGLVAAAAKAGAGEIAIASGYRSYRTQRSSYTSQKSEEGTAQAEASVARPGYSEHQSGLATDVVACANGCGTLDALAATPQGAWIATHAWEHGWIVRYESGYTGTTGYLPEPWHLRYIGVDLAKAYHDGGFHTLEDFFGLPAAPGYR